MAVDLPANKESLLFEPRFVHPLTSFKPSLQMLIQIQMTAMISSLTTSTEAPETALVTASSAWSVVRQEKTERERKGKRKEGKKHRNMKRKLKSKGSRPAELSTTCTLKRLGSY